MSLRKLLTAGLLLGGYIVAIYAVYYFAITFIRNV